MIIVCIDTQILFWATVKKAARGAEQFIPLATDLMRWIEQQKHQIIVPTIVIGELLIPVAEQDQATVLKQLSQDWMIVEYDLRAARIFAKMRRDQITRDRLHDLRQMFPDVTKKELVADLMIIATAMAHGAETIFSHNKDLRALAEGSIDTKSFEDVPLQLSLDLGEQTPDDEPGDES